MPRSDRRRAIITVSRHEDEHGLFEEIVAKARGWRGKMAILAGHYMVVYRPSSRNLVPLIASVLDADPETNQHENALLEEVGDFPEASFKRGLQLRAERGNVGDRLVMLVNDHQFQVEQQGIPREQELARLKKSYYKDNPEIPEPFRRLAEPYGPLEELLQSNDADRHGESTLPPTTYYFSENVLKKHFARERKMWLLKQPGFRYVSSKVYKTRRVVYEGPDRGDSLCLVNEQDSCGCSGTTIELLLNLAERGFEHLVMFLPDECKVPVDSSIRAMMNSTLQPFQNVIGVWADPVQHGHVPFLSATTYSLAQAELDR
jgi:hypothetical protein